MNNPFTQALSNALSYAIVSKQVSQQHEAIGFLYREAAAFEHDSGWRFFSGAEDDAYANDSANYETLPLSQILTAHPEIAPLMQQSAGAWEWNDDSESYTPVTDWQPQA